MAGTSTTPLVKYASEEQKLDMVSNYDAFVFDLDGTVWKGPKVIPGVPEVLELLRYQGKKVYFVTNNATKSRAAIAKKMSDLGLKANPEEIFSSAYAAATYLKAKQFNQKVYAVGEEGIVDEISAVGIQVLGGPEDKGKVVDWSSETPRMEIDPEVGAVVVGLDRNISYYKVQYAMLCLTQNPGCLFLATNTDARGNLSDEQEWAGAGTMVGAVIGASDLEPTVIGKPSSFILDHISRVSGVEKSKMLVIGDRLDTDILWGNRSGAGTLLVMTGITTEAFLNSEDNKIKPTYVVPTVGDLLTIKDKLSYCVIC